MFFSAARPKIFFRTRPCFFRRARSDHFGCGMVAMVAHVKFRTRAARTRVFWGGGRLLRARLKKHGRARKNGLVRVPEKKITYSDGSRFDSVSIEKTGDAVKI